jgi:hypothetical protein
MSQWEPLVSHLHGETRLDNAALNHPEPIGAPNARWAIYAGDIDHTASLAGVSADGLISAPCAYLPGS